MIDFFELTDLSICLRIVIAIFIGGLIGLEREAKNQPAGCRTYMLVCLGACLVMMTNQYICTIYSNGDPSRLGAQVVSGIGFLGAGTILVTRNNQVRGLTTAAGLWSSACIGLAVGIGFYNGAICAGIMIVFVMTVCKKLDDKIRCNSKYIRLYLTFDSSIAIDQFMKKCQEDGTRFIELQIIKNKRNRKHEISMIVSIRTKQRFEHNQFIRRLSENEEIRYIEEI